MACLEREKKYTKRKEKYMKRKENYPLANGRVLTFDTRPQMTCLNKLDFELYRDLGMVAGNLTTEGK